MAGVLFNQVHVYPAKVDVVFATRALGEAVEVATGRNVSRLLRGDVKEFEDFRHRHRVKVRKVCVGLLGETLEVRSDLEAGVTVREPVLFDVDQVANEAEQAEQGCRYRTLRELIFLEPVALNEQ